MERCSFQYYSTASGARVLLPGKLPKIMTRISDAPYRSFLNHTTLWFSGKMEGGGGEGAAVQFVDNSFSYFRWMTSQSQNRQ